MTRQDGPRTNEEHLRQGSPANSLWTPNFPLWACSDDVAGAATQVMISMAVPLQAGDIVTNITMRSGATAADTPLNWWFALYSSATTPALLGQTADQATAAWAATATKTLALATPVLITTPGLYYASFAMKATAVVSLIGRDLGLAGAASSILSSKVLCQHSGSALTDTAPATIASGTAVKPVPWICLT